MMYASKDEFFLTFDINFLNLRFDIKQQLMGRNLTYKFAKYDQNILTEVITIRLM